MYATSEFDPEISIGKTENGDQIFDEICISENLNNNCSLSKLENGETESDTLYDQRGNVGSLISEGRQMQIFSILQNCENEHSNPRPET
jgi:hypothetical protein